MAWLWEMDWGLSPIETSWDVWGGCWDSAPHHHPAFPLMVRERDLGSPVGPPALNPHLDCRGNGRGS